MIHSRNPLLTIVILFGLLTGLSIPYARAATLAATQSGSWNDPATWGGASPPTTIAAADIVMIQAGVIVSVPAKVSVNNSGSIYNLGAITVEAGGTFVNYGSLKIENGGSFANYGNITSSGAISNYGVITIEAGGMVSNQVGSDFSNYNGGNMENFNGTITDHSVIISSSTTTTSSASGQASSTSFPTSYLLLVAIQMGIILILTTFVTLRRIRKRAR
jgi:hypothetical protein